MGCILSVCVKDEEEGLSQLHLAAERGDTEAVRSLLISDNVNVNACNNDKMTPLHLACQNGHTSIVEILLDKDATLDVTDQREETPLHLAAERGHAEIVQNLMFNGANVNACNTAKMTALHLACRNGHTSIAEILLDNHAIVDVTKQSKKTPFYLAAENGHAAVSDLLIRRGVCDFVETLFQTKTPLHVAVERGHTEVVEVILKHSRRISEKLTKDGKKLQENTKRGVMPVELLKSDGRRVSAEIVWTERNTPLETKRVCLGKTPFEYAARRIDLKMFQLLLSVDHCTFSEMDIASRFLSVIEGIELLKFTDEALSDVIKYRMNLGTIVQFLINSSNFNANHQSNILDTLLHDVIRQRNKESNRTPLQSQIINDVIQLLLEKGADFNMKNSHGETPLIIASEKGYCDTIQIFFYWEEKSGIKLDLDARDRNGATALIKALKMHHVSAARLLISHKVSVNLYDYCGFTALHAAVYEPNRNWFDLHFFCKGLRKGKFYGVPFRYFSSWFRPFVDSYAAIGLLQNYHAHKEKITRSKEEMVKLLLDNDETNVNAIDFRGNTPLDLAVESSKRNASATFEALKDHGAIRKSQEPEDEAPIEEARVDDRGRNPLHRLIIASISGYASEDMKVADAREDYFKRLGLMLHGILLRPENFRESATATDDKGRTPLHYAAMQEPDGGDHDLLRVLLKLGSNVNAADIYGKTPLHYAEEDKQFELLVQYGAKKNTKDKHGYTPRDLKRLRESVLSNEYNARRLPIGKKALYGSRDIGQVFNPHLVTELTKRKLIETIRIFSQSRRPKDSSEEAIWKIWTENEPFRLNGRLSQLKPPVQQFIGRLADGIKEKDWRFECQPIIVGSANEETKAILSADFDFNFKLTNFNKLCDAFPHPLGPKGYFQLIRKLSEDTESRSDEKFDSFFNLDQCLLTNEVNSRFQILVEEVLKDPNFWQDEHLFEWHLTDDHKGRPEEPAGLCKTLRLKMINPIEDGEGGFLFIDVSVDIVACVQVEDWWLEDTLPVDISPDVKANGSTFVFDRPRFDPSKPSDTLFLFSDTFARISFALVESRIIKESSSLIKAVYIVCKMMLYYTYQLKNCVLYCMEALNIRNGSETRNVDEITSKDLAFWVERIVFCCMEFSRHDVYPCYFMPSFKQRVEELLANSSSETDTGDAIRYSAVYDIYLDLCPDDTAIDIPMDHIGITNESLCDPTWEQFDRKEFIRKLSSRNFY